MTTRKKSSEETSDREIVLTRVFDAPRERVFLAWTDPNQVVQWWGPNGFTTTTHEMEVRPGGVWRFIMHGPDGIDYPNRIVFEEIVKPERIVYAHGGGTEGAPVDFHVTVTFVALGKKTELTLRSVFPSAAARDHVVKVYGAVEGAKQHLGRLAEHLAKKPAFDLVLERIINAPRAQVFEAWTKPEHVKRWFAPRPYTLSVEKMDFRPGGSFSMAMRAPDGAEHPFTDVYREIVPPAKLVWTGEFASGPADQISTVVTFEEQGQKTKVHVRQTFHVMTPEIEQATKGAQQGWTMTLDQLEAFCSQMERLP